MLNAHPHIAIPPENRFVAPVYFGRHRFGRPGSATWGRRVGRAITRRGRGSAHLGIARDALITDFQDTPPTSLPDALRRVFGAFAAEHGKPRWGDKRPAYYALISELDTMFPDAQFIHLVRDGRACAASLKRPPFSYSPSRAIATWLNAMHAGRRAARKMPPERFLEIRYEDLVQRTEPTLRRLCSFLGEPFDPAMLHPEDVAVKHVPIHFQQHGQIASGVNQTSLSAWERELSAGEIGCIERLGRRHLQAFGYEPTRPRARSPQLLGRCWYEHLLFRLALPLGRWLDRRTDAPGVSGRLARRAWRRLRLRRFLFG